MPRLWRIPVPQCHEEVTLKHGRAQNLQVVEIACASQAKVEVRTDRPRQTARSTSSVPMRTKIPQPSTLNVAIGIVVASA